MPFSFKANLFDNYSYNYSWKESAMYVFQKVYNIRNHGEIPLSNFDNIDQLLTLYSQ
jgi:hypothetical protein